MLPCRTLFLITTFLFAAVSCVIGGNILIRPGLGSGSHYLVSKIIATELANRGHNITMVVQDRYEDLHRATGDPGDDKRFNFEFHKSNFTQVEFKYLLQNMTDAGLRGKFMEYMMELMSSDHTEKMVSECDNLIGDEELMSRLRNSNFDVMLMDASDQCPLVQFLGGPYVVLMPLLNTASPIWWENRMPFNPSYMPEFTSELNDRMSFVERLKNTGGMIFFAMFMKAMTGPYEVLRTRYDRLADASFIHADAELWLINTHFVLDFPRPLLPNTVTVGGLSAAEAAPLNREWEEYLQSAGEMGVVLFSMGSYATGVNDNVTSMFAQAFAKLPQRVIWKLNGKPSADVPSNVKVAEWIPQNDLLGHPQVKAFVYHCGMNGVWEAVYHGVPVVAIPLFADQHDNAQRIQARGMGVKVDIATLTSDELADAIRTVINNPSYQKNAARMSTIFRDTPRKPAEVVADWLEFVIRHGDAKHLRSAALDLNIFQYLLLDVLLTILVAFSTAIVLVICGCRLFFRGCRRIMGTSKKVKNE